MFDFSNTGDDPLNVSDEQQLKKILQSLGKSIAHQNVIVLRDEGKRFMTMLSYKPHNVATFQKFIMDYGISSKLENASHSGFY